MLGGLRKNRATMLRLPRQAHYSICAKLCARDTARLIETASQWSRQDDPRCAALRACVADRVERARAVVANFVPGKTVACTLKATVVPGKTIASMLKFLEAVERRDWEITPTGRDGDCSGQLRKIIGSYTKSFSGGLKDGDDIVFPPGEYRFVHIVKLCIYGTDPDGVRFPQITLRGVGGQSKALLYADVDTDLSCLFFIYGSRHSGPQNPVIRFSGLAFGNDSMAGRRRNSIVRYRYPNIIRMNDCHVRTLRSSYWRQDAGGHPVLEPLHCANMEECSEEVG